MTIKNKQELQKSIDIAKEFIQRADDLIGDIEQEHANKDKDWFGRTPVSSKDTASVRRQSMELTRQLAILRRV
jgi:hypothetical protein